MYWDQIIIKYYDEKLNIEENNYWEEKDVWIESEEQRNEETFIN